MLCLGSLLLWWLLLFYLLFIRGGVGFAIPVLRFVQVSSLSRGNKFLSVFCGAGEGTNKLARHETHLDKTRVARGRWLADARKWADENWWRQASNKWTRYEKRDAGKHDMRWKVNKNTDHDSVNIFVRSRSFRMLRFPTENAFAGWRVTNV